MDAKAKELIVKLAGVKPVGGLMDRIVDDFITGAQRNPRTGSIQFNPKTQETKLASAGFTPLDIARTAGQLQALGEAGFDIKEACELLGQTEEMLREVLETVR